MKYSYLSLLAMFVWSPLYIIPTALFCYVIKRLSKNRLPFTLFDWLLIVIPWFVWFLTMFASPTQKSLSNIAEAYVLIVVSAVVYWIRLRLSAERYKAKTVSAVAVAAVCLVGVGLALFVPALPE